MRYAPIRVPALADLEPTVWLVYKVMPVCDMGVLFGETASGKTFIVLSLAISVAMGLPWHGHPVERKRVVYLAAESRQGVHKRVHAYCAEHNIDPVWPPTRN